MTLFEIAVGERDMSKRVSKMAGALCRRSKQLRVIFTPHFFVSTHVLLETDVRGQMPSGFESVKVERLESKVVLCNR